MRGRDPRLRGITELFKRTQTEIDDANWSSPIYTPFCLAKLTIGKTEIIPCYANLPLPAASKWVNRNERYVFVNNFLEAIDAEAVLQLLKRQAAPPAPGNINPYYPNPWWEFGVPLETLCIKKERCV